MRDGFLHQCGARPSWRAQRAHFLAHFIERVDADLAERSRNVAAAVAAIRKTRVSYGCQRFSTTRGGSK
jgi:hypothetical protein